MTKTMAVLALTLGSLGAATAQTNIPKAQYGPWRSCWIGGGGYLQNVVPCPSDPKRFYAYVDVGGVYRSDDGGKTWAMLHGGLPAAPGIYEVRGLTVDPRDSRRLLIAAGSQWSAPQGIFLSEDAGKTWRKTLPAPFMGNGPERWTGFLLTRSSQNPDLLYAATEGQGVFRTTDGGKTWKPLGLPGLHPADLRVDRTNARRLWLCAVPFEGWLGGQQVKLSGGFYRSDDGGQTWNKLADGGPTELLQDPKIATRLYGTVNGRIQISDDGGNTWRDGSDGLEAHGRTDSGNSDSTFQALDAGPDFVVTASALGTFYRLPSGQTHWEKIERQGLTETYEGQTWFGKDTGRFGRALASVTVDPHHPRRWFFTDWYSIYRSDDAGAHWQLSDDGCETTVIHCFAQDPANPNVVHLGMADNGYFRSENGGIRFSSVTSISNNVKCLSVCARRPQRVYGVGPQGWEWQANQVFISDDSGKTWTRSPMTGLPEMAKRGCNTVIADPADPETVWLAVSGDLRSGGGVYISRDGGKTWAGRSQGLPTEGGVFSESIWEGGRELAVLPGAAAVAVSRQHPGAYLYSPFNDTWTLMTGMTGRPNEIASGAGGCFAAVPGDGIYRSAGAVWTKVWTGDASRIAVDAAHPNRIAAGTNDGVVLSLDGGKTWTMQDKRLPYRTGNVVGFAGDRLLAGSGGSGAFWEPLPDAAR